MTDKLPRVAKVEVKPDMKILVNFKGAERWIVDMTGFAARYPGFDKLRDPAFFAKVKTVGWGAGIGWPGELDVGAETLLRLAKEQQPFSNKDFRNWQEAVDLSNNEAADALEISLATLKKYRADSPVPTAIAIACRAMQNDPVTLAAHFQPRTPGRPKAA